MNALVKKEIRLLLPAWSVAMLLAMVQAITQLYAFYAASLLFFGLTIMALSAIGRETSLNTFSTMLAQPAERIRIWTTKLTVLAVAFLIVFFAWLVAFVLAFPHYNGDAFNPGVSDANFYNLFLTVCLIATATFTGGLWTTLLLRQLAGAFWLTLLVPATLSGFSAVFLANSESTSLVIAVLSVVIGIYSIAGFLFARRLFFRAQDVGWSGGVIELPEWKFFGARAQNAFSVRKQRPIFALIKKEFQLQQASLMGAAGLLVMHVGLMLFRTFHHFEGNNDVGEALSVIVLMAWLILVPLIGSMAVAEERRLGIMDAQLCLPVSHRVQFVVKALLTLCLATFLGGVLPLLLDGIGAHVGGFKSTITEPDNGPVGLEIMAFAAWLALVSFFGSTLAKGFLQAVGFAIGFGITTFLAFAIIMQGGLVLIVSNIHARPILPLIIAVPTVIVTLLWLAYLNFKDFREGWRLWRRLLSGLIAAGLFIFISSNAIYHRAWEVFEPAEPAHGAAKFSLANPPVIHHDDYSDALLVQLPDGRAWFDRIGYEPAEHSLRGLIRQAINPFPASLVTQQFVAGSNWVSVAVRHYSYALPDEHTNRSVYLDTVGIQSDGTLWVSDKANSPVWTGDRMTRFGDETNWQALSWSGHDPYVLLLKKDGTLWCWGTKRWGNPASRLQFTALRDLNPDRVGTNSDWKKIALDGRCLQKADGSLWWVWQDRGGKIGFSRDTNSNQVDMAKIPPPGRTYSTYVRKDGTLWFSILRRNDTTNTLSKFRSDTYQVGNETNWVSACCLDWAGIMVALKSDGTLWQHGHDNKSWSLTDPPVPLGIHNDWVAVTGIYEGVITLAADGSFWLWPDRRAYEYKEALLEFPKQPQYLGNVFNGAN